MNGSYKKKGFKNLDKSKTMEEKIKEIMYDKIELSLSGNYKSVYIDGIDNTSKEITDHVFEFIEWFTGKDSPVSVLYGLQPERFASHDKDYTIEELYQYWLTRVKNK